MFYKDKNITGNVALPSCFHMLAAETPFFLSELPSLRMKKQEREREREKAGEKETRLIRIPSAWERPSDRGEKPASGLHCCRSAVPTYSFQLEAHEEKERLWPGTPRRGRAGTRRTPRNFSHITLDCEGKGSGDWRGGERGGEGCSGSVGWAVWGSEQG